VTIDEFESLIAGGELIAPASRLMQGLIQTRPVPGFATVDLDRAQADAAIMRSRDSTSVVEGQDDDLLGAHSRIIDFGDGQVQVLLAPSTEGRLAASLARYGEAYLVEYLLVDEGDFDAAVDAARSAGLTLSPEAKGPFGRERLLDASPRWGPHLILAAHDAEPDERDAAGTITT
jgi:hypothetical protein